MNTRRHIAFFLALFPAASRLIAKDAVAPAAATAGTTKVVAGYATGSRPIPPVLYPSPVPHEVRYANCDGSKTFPTVNALDLLCFINNVAAGTDYANCDGSQVKPQITANDFLCFMNAYSLATQWEYSQSLIDP